MIYVIKTYGPNNETSIKIGYTEDKNFNKRMQAYKTHNPFYELLFTISNCTQEDEDNLHFYFRKYRKGTEWFEENEEIINFFETHKTKESIDELGLSRDLFRGKSGEIKPESTIFKENLVKWLKDNETILSKVVVNVLTHYLKHKDFGICCKFLCETIYFNRDKNTTDEDIKLILSKLPGVYSKYYTTIGPDRCKANGYNITDIKKEFENTYLIDLKELKSKIFSEFKVGERYLKSDIKEKLRKIYLSLSYSKTPKAIDLENYFDIKRCLISIDKKRCEGFELLKEK